MCSEVWVIWGVRREVSVSWVRLRAGVRACPTPCGWMHFKHQGGGKAGCATDEHVLLYRIVWDGVIDVCCGA